MANPKHALYQGVYRPFRNDFRTVAVTLDAATMRLDKGEAYRKQQMKTDDKMAASIQKRRAAIQKAIDDFRALHQADRVFLPKDINSLKKRVDRLGGTNARAPKSVQRIKAALNESCSAALSVAFGLA